MSKHYWDSNHSKYTYIRSTLLGYAMLKLFALTEVRAVRLDMLIIVSFDNDEEIMVT